MFWKDTAANCTLALGLPQQCALEGVESYGADVQGLGVEFLEVEAGALFEVGADLLPQPLAHFVGRGLARPAQIAGELEVELALADRQVLLQEVVAFVRRPGSAAPALRNLQLQVDA